MSGRQKRLAGLVLAIAVLGVFVAAGVFLQQKISEMESDLSDGRDALQEINEKTREYLDSMRRKKVLEDAIKENDSKIQTAIDLLAKKIDAMQAAGEVPSETTFDKVLRYEAKVTERAINLGDKSKKKKDRAVSDFIEISQPAEFSFVRFLDVVRFLEQVEAPDRLMYVSKLTLTQKFGDPEYVQGNVTIATFVYRPQKKEEETTEEE